MYIYMYLYIHPQFCTAIGNTNKLQVDGFTDYLLIIDNEMKENLYRKLDFNRGTD